MPALREFSDTILCHEVPFMRSWWMIEFISSIIKKKIVIHFDFWFHFVEHFSRCLLVRRDISLNWKHFSFCVLTILMIKSIVLGNVLPSSVYLILFRRFIMLVFFFFAYSIWISRCNIFRLLIFFTSFLSAFYFFYKVRQNILTFNFENFQ